MAGAVTVDFVARDHDGRWLMVLVEQGPWPAPYENELRALQSRLYDCADVALDGGLANLFPESQGGKVCIRIDGYNLPREHVQDFFDRFVEGIFAVPGYAAALNGNNFVSGVAFEIEFDSIN
jgi:hypothetical protein